MKKILTIAFATILFALPILPTKASGPDFTFRSTVMGDNVRNPHGFVYEIVNEKYNFNSNDNVYALTRIFNIRSVDSFQFKQVVYSANNNTYQTLYSPIYRPFRHWWAETYSWVNFGKMANGSYNLKTYISIDGGYFREIAQRNFNVGPHNYYQPNYDYNYNYKQDPLYSFDWTKTGLSVSDSSNYTRVVNNEKSSFNTNENIYTLTKISNLRDVYSFQIKQDIYNSNNQFVRASESNVYTPYNNYWSQSFIENNIGKLSQGNYKIKTYIKVNNIQYRYLSEKSINVGGQYYDQGVDYNYNWTQSDNNLRHESGYIYSLDNPKSTFLTNENVIVLTKLSNIRNINTFQIKHEFFLNGSSRYKTLESPVRNPNYSHWEYNYNSNNFGTMPEGNHKIKVFIRINNGSWTQIDEISVRINQFGNYPQPPQSNTNYNYDWTQTGSEVSATTNPSLYYAYRAPN